jgi:hypothetical protein
MTTQSKKNTLVELCYSGDLSAVQAIIEQLKSWDLPVPWASMLHQAINNSNDDLIKFIVTNGADIINNDGKPVSYQYQEPFDCTRFQMICECVKTNNVRSLMILLTNPTFTYDVLGVCVKQIYCCSSWSLMKHVCEYSSIIQGQPNERIFSWTSFVSDLCKNGQINAFWNIVNVMDHFHISCCWNSVLNTISFWYKPDISFGETPDMKLLTTRIIDRITYETIRTSSRTNLIEISIHNFFEHDDTDDITNYLEEHMKKINVSISWNYMLFQYRYCSNASVFWKILERGASNFHECLDKHLDPLFFLSCLLNFGIPCSVLSQTSPALVAKLENNKAVICQWLTKNMIHFLCPQVIQHVLIPFVAY